MQCPGCLSSLSTIGYKGMAMYECEKCRSRWFDGEEVERIQNIPDKDPEIRWVDFEARDTQPVSSYLQSKAKICPRCLTKMTPFRYMKTPLFLERCLGCKGVYLTREQLQEVMRQSSSWITKRMPNRKLMFLQFAIMAGALIFIIGYVAVIRMQAGRDDGFLTPAQEYKMRQQSAQQYQAMRRSMKVDQEMMRIQAQRERNLDGF